SSLNIKKTKPAIRVLMTTKIISMLCNNLSNNFIRNTPIILYFNLISSIEIFLSGKNLRYSGFLFLL
ncbi:hypothetical protein DQ178_15710, partial [Enterococcus faecalis]|nr:hypothetical protein [Enterococcus faecalis]